MHTKVLKIHQGSLAKAAALLQRGELVAFPTETVYGLGANALRGSAVAKIFAAKGRPCDNPLIVHVCSMEQMKLLGIWNPYAQQVFDAFMPGPITMVLKKQPHIPSEVTAGLDTVGLRFPEHPGAQALIRLAGPIAAPSANLSGRPSPTEAAHVYRDLAGRIPLILDGGPCGVGVESTVLSLAGTPTLLRPGGVTLEQLRAVLPNVQVHQSVLENVHLDSVASPGMKYKHYAPSARVVLIAGQGEKALQSARRQGLKCRLYKSTDPVEEAHMLFERLRSADAQKLDLVLFEMPSQSGLGLSVANRLLRASAFTVLHPNQAIQLEINGKNYTLSA